MTAAGAVVGVFLPVILILAVFWLLAFPRQRNEARAEIERVARPLDLAGLAAEFSAWVVAKRAAMPRFGSRWMSPMFHPEHPLAAVYQQQDDLARFHAQVRAEYHDRFRARVVAIVGADTPDPQTVADLEELAKTVQALASDARKAAAIAAAQGTALTDQHFLLLEALRDQVHMQVLNEHAIDYGDPVNGEPQHQDSFLAHYRPLRERLETWQSAIQDRDARLSDLAALIPQEVARFGIRPPEFVDSEVAECFSEDILAAVRRREYTVRTLQLRCVGDVIVEGSENRWSAYLHSGRRDYKVAELQGPKVLTNEGVVDYHETVVKPLEMTLGECYRAIHESAAVAHVKATHERLERLRQPLIDELLRQKTGASPVFTPYCPYCLATIGF